jgi:hypothetical protein
MPHAETGDSSWKSLYKIGGVAALIAAVLFLSDIFVLTIGGAAPDSAEAWFTLLQDNRVAGLIQLFFSDLVGVALLVPVVLALYIALRRTHAAYALLTTVLAFIGIALVFATNGNYSLIYLSDQYATASTALQKSQLLTAAESMLANGMWSTGALMASFLIEGALVLISVLMLRGSFFSKGIAYVGIAAHGLDCARTIVFLIAIPLVNPDTALAIGTPLLIVGGTLQLIWYPLVGLRLLKLERDAAENSH